MKMLMAAVLALGATGSSAAIAQTSLADRAGPVIDEVKFVGNKTMTSAQLRQIAALPVGSPLSADIVKPALDRIQAAYDKAGGAIVYPNLDEIQLDHARVTFMIREGQKAWPEGPEAGTAPKWLDAYFGNTMVCAAAKTSNDLCHIWLNKDGTFLIFDPNGMHRGHYTIGKVRPDGRVPICRYWDSAGFIAPDGTAGQAMAMRKGPNGEEPGTVCTTADFRTKCPRYPDVRQLSAEDQRKARRNMVERNHEEGICYAHGPHKVGDVWYEWDDPLPGQIGLDRQMLLPGHQ